MKVPEDAWITQCIEKKQMSSIKVDLDAADVDGAEGYHAEEADLLASEHGAMLIENKEILQTFGHPG